MNAVNAGVPGGSTTYDMQQEGQQEGHLQIALFGAKDNSMWVAHTDTGDQPFLASHLQRCLYCCATLQHELKHMSCRVQM